MEYVINSEPSKYGIITREMMEYEPENEADRSEWRSGWIIRTKYGWEMGFSGKDEYYVEVTYALDRLIDRLNRGETPVYGDVV